MHKVLFYYFDRRPKEGTHIRNELAQVMLCYTLKSFSAEPCFDMLLLLIQINTSCNRAAFSKFSFTSLYLCNIIVCPSFGKSLASRLVMSVTGHMQQTQPHVCERTQEYIRKSWVDLSTFA